MILAEISSPIPPDNLVYVVYAMIAGFCIAAAAVATVVLKFGTWIKKGAMENLKSEEGRKIVVDHITDSATISDKIQAVAGVKVDSAIGPLLTKFDALTTEVVGMRKDMHEAMTRFADSVREFSDNHHGLDKRLDRIEHDEAHADKG